MSYKQKINKCEMRIFVTVDLQDNSSFDYNKFLFKISIASYRVDFNHKL